MSAATSAAGDDGDAIAATLRRGVDVGARLLTDARSGDPITMLKAVDALANPLVVPIVVTFYAEALRMLAEGLSIDEATVHARVADAALERHVNIVRAVARRESS